MPSTRKPHETILPTPQSGETLLPDDLPVSEEDALGMTLLPSDVGGAPPPGATSPTPLDGTILPSPFDESSETWQDQEVALANGTTHGESGGEGIIEASYQDAPTDERSRDSLDPSRATVLPKLDRTTGNPRLVVTGTQRFRIVQSLGQGGVGDVLLAVDNDIGRKVAIKRIRPDRKTQGAFLRFVQEIQTIGRLEHPNIIPIHDVGRDEDGEYYFVMKYVDGETLEEIIDKLRDGDPETHRRYTFERRMQIFQAVLEAVAFAHSRGVIHRDIKPANVMVARYGEVLLLDWGIARADDVDFDDEVEGGTSSGGRLTETRAGALLGTPGYMAPEQARGETVDERADVYALSVMLHELLTLHHYLEDASTLDEVIDGVQNREVPLASSVKDAHQPPVPMDLQWYVRKGVYKEPGQRYQSVEEMIDRLERRTDGEIPIECHITFTKRIFAGILGFVDRHPMLSTMGMVLGLLGMLGAFTLVLVTAVGLALLV